MRAFKAAAAALIFVAGFAGAVAAGPLEDGVAAYDGGDYATALRLMRPLAEQGNADAQNHLGQMYRQGQGVPQDYAAAMKWYRKAAEQGYIPGQINLANMYEWDQGVQDRAAAASWYRKAAEQGDARAQLELGLMYDFGWGVPRDYVLAHMWLNLSAARTDRFDINAGEAVKARDILATMMTPAQIAEAQKLAREWKPK
jgi:TPR repeat protein